LTLASATSARLGGLFVVCFILLLFLLNGDAVVLTWISNSISQYVSTIEQVLAYVVVGGFAAIIIKSQGITWKEIGITRQKLMLSLPVLFALGIATTLVAWLGGKWPQMFESTRSGLTLPLPIVILIVLIVAVVEEFIFRGYVQIGTKKHFGVMAGMIVSAGVFAISHIPADISAAGIGSSAALISVIPSLSFQAIGRFAFALMAFAAMYELTGNIFITIITHSFYDFSVVYYPPAGGSATVVVVCLLLPFVVVFLTNALRSRGVPSSQTSSKKTTSAPLLRYLPRLLRWTKRSD
jgi:membrane protease YdiL (CAAX protease family)